MKETGIEIAQAGMGKQVNQDYAVSTNIALVLDGCGSGQYSEYGSRRIGEIIRKNSAKLNEKNFEYFVNRIMRKVLITDSNEDNFNSRYQFTIVACLETEKNFIIMTAGDGYIVTIDKLNNIKYMQVDNNINIANGDAPGYIAYNLNPNSDMYNSNIYFKKMFFAKSKYSRVYVASDGLRFILNTNFPKEEKAKFEEALILGNSKEIEIVLQNNRNKIFDDISIASIN